MAAGANGDAAGSLGVDERQSGSLRFDAKSARGGQRHSGRC